MTPLGYFWHLSLVKLILLISLKIFIQFLIGLIFYICVQYTIV